jgi:hypothetical protein
MKSLTANEAKALREIELSLDVNLRLASWDYDSAFLKSLKDLIKDKGKEARDRIFARSDEIRARERERTKEFKPRLKGWVLRNIKPGMILKMQGCRDGHGIREVISVNGERSDLKCYKIHLPRKGPTSRTQITNHMMDKVLGIVTISEDESLPPSQRYTYRPIKKMVINNEHLEQAY